MSWAQLLLWSVLLSFASWASILFVRTSESILGPYCKVLPIVNLLHSNLETLVYLYFRVFFLNKVFLY